MRSTIQPVKSPAASPSRSGSQTENHNNILAICVLNPFDLRFMENSFRLYFGNSLDIRPVSPDELDTLDVTPRAVITTHLTTELARKKFPHASIVLSKRGLTGEALEEVVQLPRGTKALVVNSPRQVAIETKDALTELGIDHIDTRAYWPGAPIDIEGYNVVIYAGIMSYCPQGKNYQYINIGHRCIALSTIIDIIRIFGLSSGDATKYYNDNIQRITESCYKLSEALNQTKMIKESFEKICDINKSIIFAIDSAGRIVVFNDAAVSFFGLRRRQALGRDYRDALRNYPALTEAISTNRELNEMLITAKGQKLLVTAENYYIDNYDNRLISIVPFAALQQSESKARMKLHETGFLARHTFADILGSSDSVERCKRTARIYANTNTTILITGESGTGKEVFAQAIHNASARSQYPFVGINFAALPETLAESELFGYAEGSFTGAMKGGKEGLFEIAHNGTIFLDEIGDASLAVQAKLLRVLEEKEIVRVGGTRVIPIDVRIICATNRDLPQMMREGTFRADLYYRIKVLSLHLSPLRERRCDVLSILTGMLKENAVRRIMNDQVRRYLMAYDWPGNIRELRTIAEYINMLADMSEMDEHDESEIRSMLQYFLENNLAAAPSLPGGTAGDADFARPADGGPVAGGWSADGGTGGRSADGGWTSCEGPSAFDGTFGQGDTSAGAARPAPLTDPGVPSGINFGGPSAFSHANSGAAAVHGGADFSKAAVSGGSNFFGAAAMTGGMASGIANGMAPHELWLPADLLCILRAVDKLQKQSVIAGRGSLSRLPELQAVGMTETKIKTRLKKLDQLGCIVTGSTKQGVSLTPLGARTLLLQREEK